MIWAIRQLVTFAIVAILLVFLARWIPTQFSRAQVPIGYDDLDGLQEQTGVWLSGPPFNAGDAVAYRTGDGPEDVGFGFVAGLPGNRVTINGEQLLIDGVEAQNWRPVGTYRGLNELGPLIVPANHLFVISHEHQRDSLALGLIAPDRVLGKVKE